MNNNSPIDFALAASDVLVLAGLRYRPLGFHADGLIITHADKPATPIYFPLCDLSQHLETGALTIERENERPEVSNG
ncbi:hypothetical protein [Shinella sp.]|uniref:hypothetical protein n=1 Tax=Shinella sp. TaxID=1870904 RepID=UPI00289E2C97|nr:hypothetical protein [Shinella sp.]